MTDEERAHAVVFWIPGLDDDWRNSLLRRVAADFSEIRADEREKCAQQMERVAAERKQTAEQISAKIQEHAAAGAGKKCAKLRSYRQSMQRRRLAFEDAAAAIRKGGET